MKDRTMVLLAVLFLVVTVGAGVNLSLEACNRMVGRPLTPGLGQVYRRQAPVVCNAVKGYTSVVEARVKKAVLPWLDRLTERTGAVRQDRFPEKTEGVR